MDRSARICSSERSRRARDERYRAPYACPTIQGRTTSHRNTLRSRFVAERSTPASSDRDGAGGASLLFSGGALVGAAQFTEIKLGHGEHGLGGCLRAVRVRSADVLLHCSRRDLPRDTQLVLQLT